MGGSLLSTPSRAAGLLLVALLALAAPALAQVRLPDMGDAGADALSPADERRLGEAFMREIRASVKVIDDPEISAYLDTLGHRLSAAAHDPSRHFHFFVVQAPDINAFAGPSGYIGVNSGLMLATERESELAAVLAHEIAHVTQRHIARAFANADRSNIPALAGLLAAVVIGTQNAQAGQATAAAVLGLRAQSEINFTRSNEIEADQIGMQVLHDAGYDPHSMPSFFEKLQLSSRYYSKPPEFLMSHPVTSARIADARARAEDYPYRQYSDSLAYAMMRAKLRVITSDDPAKPVKYFAARVAQVAGGDTHTLAARYGHALALDRDGKHEDALAELERLDRDVPDRISVRLALAKAKREAGDIAGATGILADLYGLYPDDDAVVRGYGDALIEQGKAARAIDILERQRQHHSFDAAMYRLIARAYERNGQPGESHHALAEHFYLDGHLDDAIGQLEIAQRQDNPGYYVSARIDARLQELRAEQTLRNRKR